MVKLGQHAPNFEHVSVYKNGVFETGPLLGKNGSWTVLFFYPHDFTFICPTELRAFAAHAADFAKHGCDLVAGSTDSVWSHKAWFSQDLPEVTYPVFADTTHAISRAYGVLDETDGSSQRGLFIIDPEQMVRYMLISSGSVGRSVEETLRVLEALQTGELCPVDWKPGEAIITRP